MRSASLTERQQEIVAFLRRFHAEYGRPPTRHELCAAFGFRSLNAAQSHLMALAEKGVIALDAGRARGIRLLPPWCDQSPTETGNRPASLPIIGRVAAGEPILAVAHIENFLPIAPDAFHPRADYLLRVEGESMLGAGILPGDLVAVRQTPEAVPGAIVVARLGDEVTVKRLRYEGNALFLKAANNRYPPRRVDPERDLFAIEGVVVGLVRPQMT